MEKETIVDKGKKKPFTFFIWKTREMDYIILLFILCLIADLEVKGQGAVITKKNISFIEYPDFPDANSSWGSIGYNVKYNTVYVGVTNHHNKVGFYEYNPSRLEIKLKGFIDDLGYLRPFQWQAKIHSKIIFASDGTAYFTTDGGESREEYLMDHPQGYVGGFFMKWNPATNQMTNLGLAMPYESLKDIEIDPQTDMLYAVTYPQAHFLLYNPAKNELRDLGRLASSHVPRVLFSDWWGNCYYVDWRQRLVKYEKEKGCLVFAENSLPFFEGTPGSKIITGITAFSKDERNKIIYLITYGAKIIAFHPQKEGIGPVEDLGGVADTGDQPEWGPYVPNLNIGNNGKLYYIVGGHGNYLKKDTGVLMEFNPKTLTRKIIYEYQSDELAEATGSDIKDKDGNLYFAGRRESKNKSNSKPFMIKFNPEKEVQK
jgi:hypothetical protein